MQYLYYSSIKQVLSRFFSTETYKSWLCQNKTYAYL